MTSMTDWLSALPETALTALLSSRPDSLQRPQPRSLAELAARLERRTSMAAALQAVPLPAVQLAEAIGALGSAPTRDELAGFVGGDAAATDRWLAVLADHAVLWPAGDGTLAYPDGLPGLFGTPLGLGPPLRELIAGATVEHLRRILSALGVRKPPTRRDEVLATVQRALSNPDVVRRAVDLAPPQIAAEVRSWASEHVDDAGGYAVRYDPESYRAKQAAGRWAIERGLAFGSAYGSAWRMPAEVARALRGSGYHAPFDPVTPEVTATALTADEVAQQAARAASQFADLVLALVDRVTRTPVPALKSGGLGVREIDRLVKQLGCTEPDLRLALELCAATEVLEPGDRTWRAGAAATRWREGAPADRMAILVQRWWELASTPGDLLDEDGKRAPALVPRACGGCVLARQTVVTTLAGLGENVAAEPAALCRRAQWLRPFAHALGQDAHRGDGVVFATHLGEAGALGIVAAGALTRLGAAVIAGDPQAVRDVLAAALPASADTALFGADLTAVVPGAPSAAVSRLLDGAADRESRGGATVWRFSPGSVRRALDAGILPDTLVADLAAIATGELPQPLRYLIGDIARQHGNLRVASATSVIRGMDESLLATVAADRALRKLGLRRLAPTVLGSDADAGTVLVALRAAGYLPMPELRDDPGAPAADHADDDEDPAQWAAEMRGEMLRAARGDLPRPAREKSLDAAALAGRLLAAGGFG